MQPRTNLFFYKINLQKKKMHLFSLNRIFRSRNCLKKVNAVKLILSELLLEKKNPAGYISSKLTTQQERNLKTFPFVRFFFQ